MSNLLYDPDSFVVGKLPPNTLLVVKREPKENQEDDLKIESQGDFSKSGKQVYLVKDNFEDSMQFSDRYELHAKISKSFEDEMFKTREIKKPVHYNANELDQYLYGMFREHVNVAV